MTQVKIEAVKVRRLYLEVAGQIENLIRSGEIKPGERLPSERTLATSFNVSRPTIREAMIALEIANLVEIRTGSGIYALPQEPSMGSPELEDVPGPFEILEARLLIEPEAAALACGKLDAEQLKQIESAIAILAQADASDEAKEKADQSFHCTIAQATQNSAIYATVEWLWQLRSRSPLTMTFHRKVSELGVAPLVEEHQAILHALVTNQPEQARAAMKAHLSNSIEKDISVLELDQQHTESEA